MTSDIQINCEFIHKFSSVQFGSVQFSSVRFSSVRVSSVRFGSVQFSSVRFSSVRFSSVRFSSVQFIPSHRTQSVSTTAPSRFIPFSAVIVRPLCLHTASDGLHTVTMPVNGKKLCTPAKRPDRRRRPPSLLYRGYWKIYRW